MGHLETALPRLPLLLVACLLFLQSCAAAAEDKPFIRKTTTAPREFREGEDVLLTCVVTNLGNHTVWWSRNENGERKKILTIADRSITYDNRISVLHDRAGGDVWVLVIKSVQLDDAGVYMCEVNSNPILTSHYVISVKPSNSSEPQEIALRSNHNYTQCCQDNGVMSKCLGFCAIHNILEGTSGIEPEACESYFPAIVRCMADMRNHVPCCEKERVPDLCQDLCRGDYTIQEDNIKKHFSCTAYTEVTLMCISEGVEILPKAPESPSVTVLGPTTMKVQWSPPPSGTPAPEHYIINITTITKFDPPADVTTALASTTGGLDKHDDLNYLPKQRHLKVSANRTEVMVRNLSPLTWYEVSVISQNRHGSSLVPYSLRALTKAQEANKTEIVNPELPDIIGCCNEKGVKHYRCTQNLCDPNTRYITEPDMIVCAPWAAETFSCLANDVDHSDCCLERGLPPLCVELCSGNVTKIDYKYFKCVDYFTDYRSCLMRGYDVLPGPPTAISVTNVKPTFALLHWRPSELHAASISAYHAFFRPIQAGRGCKSDWFMDNIELAYRGVYTDSPPYVLEHLCPETQYEVYVQAVNTYGTSDSSARVLFRTPSLQQEKRLEDNTYNITKCCENVNISPGCMPLCDYNARMTHVRALASICAGEMSSLLRCGVGGRNHRPCCRRRGVPTSCLSVCSGSFTSDRATPALCMPYIGNIMMCLEEGVGVLPGPVTDLHATKVTNGSVTLVWQPPKENVTVGAYQIQYQSVDKHSASKVIFNLNNTINVTNTAVTLTNLTAGKLYNIFVISLNEEGKSLPSSVLTINATDGAHSEGVVVGVPSAPHSLVLDSKTATSLTIVWQPPELAHPTDSFTYKLHFRALGSPDEADIYNTTVTGATARRLEDLTPNTQYVLYVTAMNKFGDSRPSETLLAWTDPAYPAFVETPTVHPINLIVEGGTMTVLCIAMGSPPPTVSLYISGVLIHQDVTRHMVTVVHNVTRDMTEISCYADNGYGTPMQTSRTITISRRPQVTAQATVQVVAGRSVTLECTVDAWPVPSLVWWRDPDGRVPVIHGGNYAINKIDDFKGEGTYLMQLTIRSFNQSEGDSYYCHASNAFGTFTQTIKLEMAKPLNIQIEVSECCRVSNVSDTCMDACSFDELDFDRVMNREECIPDFGKLMKCAADGSDHRSCCSQKGVPTQCLDWCRGEPVARSHLCQLQWAPLIFACFNEGQDELPGPPLHVQIVSDSESTARVTWEPPVKNPDTVELYRVFWRPLGQRAARKNDTSQTDITIAGLSEGTTYEIAVKAGNHKGTSILTPTLTFTHRVQYVTSASTHGSSVAVAVGVVIAVVLLCVCVVVGIWARKNKLLFTKSASNGGISFENPSYIREQNGDTVQIAETPSGSLNGNITSGMNGGVNGGVNGGMNGGMNGGISPTDVSGGVWNTHNVTSSTPGFEDDLPSNGGYRRFNS